MGIRVSGPEVVAFLEWVRTSFPDVKAVDDIGERALHELAEGFVASHFDDDRIMRGRHGHQHGRWSLNQGLQWLDRPLRYFGRSPDGHGLARDLVLAVKNPQHMSENWSRRYGRGAPRVDLLNRYRSIPFRSIFLYTTQDRLFSRYLRQHWSAWSNESGDLFDFYDFSIQDKDEESYSFSQAYIFRLRAIPCADITKIRAVGLPCMLVWSDYDNMIVPFADVAESESGLRDRFRLVQRFLDQDQFDALRSHFSDTIRQAVSSREDVFLSYRRADRPWVQNLHDALESAGISVWFDEHLRAGDRFDLRIVHHLSNAKAAVVVWSRSSISSGYVLAEALMAWNRRRLLPVAKDVPIEVPPPFNTVHVENLSQWPQQVSGFERLVERLRDARESDGVSVMGATPSV